MKKITSFFLAIVALITMVSCGSKKGNTTEEIGRLSKPVITLTDNVVSWDSVKNAQGYIVKVNNEEKEEQIETTYTINGEGTFVVSVKAVSSDLTKWYSSVFSNEVTYTLELSTTTLWIVGDSTACNYYNAQEDTFVDNKYYYPRYGYGMQFENYFSEKLNIKNLALSGRSSVSFLADDNYKTLFGDNGIKKGDYLLIAFGHNDEKSGSTFTDATKSIDDSTSFKYSLYNNYIKKAEEKNANPILATPIVRLDSSNLYEGDKAHDTATGNYSNAIVELGNEKNIPVIDLTTITKDIYKNLGYDQAKYFHAMSTIFTDDTQTTIGPNLNAPDGTHLNVYGSKRVAYEFASALKNSSSSLKSYVNTNNVEPTKETDLVMWKKASKTPYSTPDLENYEPKPMFTTITEGWYGTAMGNCGGNPNAYDETYQQAVRNGFYATETSEGVFKVGQYVMKEDSTTKEPTDVANIKGKTESTAGDGFAFAFMQISTTAAFTFTADVEILENVMSSTNNNKSGMFGLMLRDDALINLDSVSGKEAVTTNYVVSGLILNDIATAGDTSKVSFKREGEKLSKGSEEVASLYKGDKAKLTLKRENQTIICIVEINGVSYTSEYKDIKFNEQDEDFMYIGMCANRGILCEFTNVNYQYDGEAQEA